MKALKLVLTLALIGILSGTGSVVAQPAMINYQGKLAHETGWPVIGNVSIVFSIYDQVTGGIPLWTETHSSVCVQSGIYNVLLGSVNPIPDDVFDGGDRWLGIRVNDDSEMSPRQRIASVGYAINSDMVDGLHASYFGDAHSLDAADGNPTDAVYVNNAGNVGIGVTNPMGTLHLKGGSTLLMGKGGYGSSTIWLGGPHHNSVPYAHFETAGNDGADNARLEIKTYGDTTPTMTLMQGGKVGIGTTEPQEKLDVNGAAYVRGGLSVDGSAKFGGNVGIGTDDPQAKLHVKGDSWQNEGDESTIFLGDANNYIKSTFGRGIQINTFYGDDGIFLQKEGGNVGIGTMNPTSRLQVAGRIHSTSGGFKFPDGSIQTSAAATPTVWNGQFKVTIDSKTEAPEKYEENYALLIYNDETDDYGEDGIAIQLGTDKDGNYGKANHFMGFYDLEGDYVGAIQGFRTQQWVLDHGSGCGDMNWSDLFGLILNPLQNNCVFDECELAETGFDPTSAAAYASQMVCNNKGVVYTSNGSDYAEWLPKQNLVEEMTSGDIVGLSGGRISKSTEDAEKVMVISTGPVVLGNTPREEEEDQFEPVAFLGQVIIKVTGPVRFGDYILPSGFEDGTGIGVPAEDMTVDDYSKVVGRAWSQSNYPGLKPVLCAVGLDSHDWVRLVGRQQNLLLEQERRIEDQECLIAELLNRLDTLEQRVNEISGVSGENMSVVMNQGR